MKNIKRNLKIWFTLFLKLVWEIILFFLNLPRYFYLFLHGLRVTSTSYSKLLDAISSRKKTIDNVFKSKIDAQEVNRIWRTLHNEIVELNKEQEKLFTGLFGLFIAILALFISIIALLIKR